MKNKEEILKQEASPLGRQGMLPVFIVPAVEKGKTFSNTLTTYTRSLFYTKHCKSLGVVI